MQTVDVIHSFVIVMALLLLLPSARFHNLYPFAGSSGGVASFLSFCIFRSQVVGGALLLIGQFSRDGMFYCRSLFP